MSALMEQVKNGSVPVHLSAAVNAGGYYNYSGLQNATIVGQELIHCKLSRKQA